MRRHQDFISGQLDTELSSSGTTMVSQDLEALMEITGNDHLMIQLDPEGDNGEPEIVKVVAHGVGSNEATIERGADGTTARTHATASEFKHGPIASDYAGVIREEDMIGVIAEWSGLLGDIPNGWQVCDGTSPTPDLTDKFLVGAGALYNVGDTGGANEVAITTAQMAQHNHGSTGGHQHASVGNHNHGGTGTTGSSHTHGSGNTGSTSPNSAGSHSHTMNSQGSHRHDLDVRGTTNTNHTHVSQTFVAQRVPSRPNFAGDDWTLDSVMSNAGSHSHTTNSTGGHTHGSHNHSISSSGSGHTHSISNDGGHQHASAGSHTHTNVGSGNAHENRPPYYAVFYIMFVGF